MIIALPLHIMLQNQGMLWTRYGAYQEQPAFEYSGEMYAEVVLVDTATNAQSTYKFSTVQVVADSIENPIYPAFSALPIYSSSEEGKVDQYNVSLSFRKPLEGQAIAKVTLMMGLNAELRKIFKADVNGVAFAEVETQASSKLNVGQIRIAGEVKLHDTPYKIQGDKTVVELGGGSLFSDLPLQSVTEVMNDYFFSLDTVLEYKVKSKQVLYAPDS